MGFGVYLLILDPRPLPTNCWGKLRPPIVVEGKHSGTGSGGRPSKSAISMAVCIITKSSKYSIKNELFKEYFENE